MIRATILATLVIFFCFGTVCHADEGVDQAQLALMDLIELQSKLQGDHFFLCRIYQTKIGVDEKTGAQLDGDVRIKLRLEASKEEQEGGPKFGRYFALQASNSFDAPSDSNTCEIELVRDGTFYSKIVSFPAPKKYIASDPILDKSDLPEVKWYRHLREMNPLLSTIFTLEHNQLGLTTPTFCEKLIDFPMRTVENGNQFLLVEITQNENALKFAIRIKFDKSQSMRPVLTEWYALSDGNNSRKLRARIQSKWKKRGDDLLPSNIYFHDFYPDEESKLDYEIEWFDPELASDKLFEPEILQQMLDKRSPDEAISTLLGLGQ